MIVTLLIALVIFSYLLGNISFARIIAGRRKVDITKQGSGNPGATNTLRTLGGKAGLVVFFLDILKGIIPAIIAVFAFGGYTTIEHGIVLYGTNESYFALYLCGLAAVLGHTFPIIYKFKGGKGIATMTGIFLVSQPILTLIVFFVCFLCMLCLKYMSAISMLFITTLAVLQMVFVPTGNNVGLYIVLALLLFLTYFGHRANIVRLYNGTENKLDLLKYLIKHKNKKNIDSVDENSSKDESKIINKENATKGECENINNENITSINQNNESIETEEPKNDENQCDNEALINSQDCENNDNKKGAIDNTIQNDEPKVNNLLDNNS